MGTSTKSFQLAALEGKRVAAQNAYDHEHGQEYRNIRGQFATPNALAREIAVDLVARTSTDVSLIEPSCGTGSFVSAVRSIGHTGPILAVEKDETLAEIAQSLWADDATTVECADFFSVALANKDKFGALIANPPYSRHHHLSRVEKESYSITSQFLGGVRLSSLAGLHAYFMVAGTAMLKRGGVASWLVPSEIFAVNYGAAVREFLTGRAKVERIHIFSAESLQFSDALVSSCVVIVRNEEAHGKDEVEVTTGDFATPVSAMKTTIEELRAMPKWQHLGINALGNEDGVEIGTLLKTRRGIATGGNSFFVRKLVEWEADGIDREWLTPLIPPPRRHKGIRVDADETGWPIGIDDALLTIPKDVPEEELPEAVRAYIESCPDKVRNGYICSHRTPWYAVETCDPPQILCTYMGRSESSPFRFIRNHSCAIATNSYVGLYAKNDLADQQLNELCDALNAIDAMSLVAGGREYGGGLKKLEPKELMRVKVPIKLAS